VREKISKGSGRGEALDSAREAGEGKWDRLHLKQSTSHLGSPRTETRKSSEGEGKKSKGGGPLGDFDPRALEAVFVVRGGKSLGETTDPRGKKNRNYPVTEGTRGKRGNQDILSFAKANKTEGENQEKKKGLGIGDEKEKWGGSLRKLYGATTHTNNG